MSFDRKDSERMETAMRNRIYTALATMILVSVLGVSAQAQSRNQQQLSVNVPFTFNVGNTTMPAGDYKVRIVNPASDRSVLQLTNLNLQTNAMVRTTDIIGWTNSKAKLTFRHYGDQYFLAQVWMASEANGLATPSSSSEKKLQRQLGQTGKSFDMVAVNAR